MSDARVRGVPTWTTLKALAEAAGIPPTTLAYRLNKGMSLEEAQATPLRHVDLNVIGQERGLLTIRRYLGKNARGLHMWECSCACGTPSVIVSDTHIKSGNTSSCGCLKKAADEALRQRNVERCAVHEVDGVRYSLNALSKASGVARSVLRHRMRVLGMSAKEAAFGRQSGSVPSSAEDEAPDTARGIAWVFDEVALAPPSAFAAPQQPVAPAPIAEAQVVKVHHGAQNAESSCRRAWIGEFGSRGSEDPARVTCERCRAVLRKRGLLKAEPAPAAPPPMPPSAALEPGVEAVAPPPDEERCSQGLPEEPAGDQDPESFREDPSAAKDRDVKPENQPRRPRAPRSRAADDRPAPSRDDLDLAAEIAGIEEEQAEPQARRRGRPKRVRGAEPETRRKLSYKDIAGEQEAELIRRYKAGDRQAGEILVQAHEPFIFSMARRYFNKGCDVDDLLQEARLGFLHGVKLFDPDRGYTLCTYAAWWARQHPARYLQDNRADVRIPVHIQEALGAARRVGAETPEEIAQIDRHGAKLAAAKIEATRRPMSLDALTHEHIMDRPMTLGDTIVDEGPRPDELVDEADTSAKQAAIISGMLAKLNQQQRAVIRMRFLSDDPLTLEEAGQRMGVTRERIRQIEAKALDRMRREVRLAQMKPGGGVALELLPTMLDRQTMEREKRPAHPREEMSRA